MAIFKCKMCGGDLEVTPGMSIAECMYCGTEQTLPTVDNDALQSLFNRANFLRMKSEFDKAADIYEKILQKSETEAEAYWGLILCKYGIEYVEDPATFKRVPTCHRASYDAVVSDEDYKNAINYADATQRKIYEQEAKTIDEIQKGILALAQKEEPYDVFICYKESDENGRRTPDSVIANDIYHQLTQEGFKVFYAAISLEDKLGKEYEPYIFSALNTAKVMLSLGTRPEYFNAVWVKNEWSRFLKIMKKDRSKLLIPCYKDMDPYELPEEFAHLQAQDMGKIGFINDVVRGIKKVVMKEAEQPKVQETVAAAPVYASNVTALLDRGNMALEDHEWDKADGFFEEVLNQDARCAEAYLGKFLAQKKQMNLDTLFQMFSEQYAKQTLEQLEACAEETAHISAKAEAYTIKGYLKPETVRSLYTYNRIYNSPLSCRQNQYNKQKAELEKDRLLGRARQYAKGELADQLTKKLEDLWALHEQRIAKAEQEDRDNKQKVVETYKKQIEYADKKAEELYEDASLKREDDYQAAVSDMNKASSESEYVKAKSKFLVLADYKESKENVEKCQKEIERLEEKERQERKLQAEKAAKKKKKIIAGVAGVIAACVAGAVVVIQVIIPNNHYKAAMELKESGKYEEAIQAFGEMAGYKDSADQIESCYIGLLGEETYKLMKTINVGDEYIFGAYEQDNNTSNGKEDIEWIVLDKEGAQILVTSKCALDSQAYNSYETVTWESCTLREWLNDIFIIDAFDEDERTKIVETLVTADLNPKYSTNPGKDTTDKIFLLSIPEAEKYFANDEERKCVPTEYAIAQGAWTSDSETSGGKATCWWWLRSPGSHDGRAAGVGGDGSVYSSGYRVYRDSHCVRPALWINLAP